MYIKFPKNSQKTSLIKENESLTNSDECSGSCDIIIHAVSNLAISIVLITLQELVNNMSYNEKSDIWSMGCVLYELCALHPPFTASSQTELNRKIRLGSFSRIPARYTDDLNDVISKMLHVEVHFEM